jgi:hypothetical protein
MDRPPEGFVRLVCLALLVVHSCVLLVLAVTGPSCVRPLTGPTGRWDQNPKWLCLSLVFDMLLARTACNDDDDDGVHAAGKLPLVVILFMAATSNDSKIHWVILPVARC